MILSVQRADRILDLFSSDISSWSVSEMAEELEVSKSVAWEYARTLEQLGILRKDGANRYRLGWRTFQLGLRARLSSEIAGPARVEIKKLASELQETIHLVTRHRDQVVYLEKSVPTNGIQINATRVGERLPAHTTASGKVLLSSLTEAELLELYPEAELPTRTPASTRDRAALLAELSDVIRLGYASDREGTITGLCGLAAPITNRHGDIAWALSMKFYSYKWASHAERYRQELVDAAARLSAIAQESNY